MRKIFKNTKRGYFATMAALLFWGAPLLAQQHEVTGASYGSLGYENDDSGTWFNLGASVGYDLLVVDDFLQLGAEVGLGLFRSKVDGESSVVRRSFSIVAGPTFNFGGTLPEAFFVTTRVGFSYSKSTSSDSAVALLADVDFGKRFEIVSNVIYKPSVGVQYSRFDGDSDVAFYIRFLSLSVLF